ncbi:MAG: ADP-glyceromanno-heptose 6-epimerase [Chthoniobacterales bacterium]|nr:ADP-glyceromanno-heptose 6-epimerase [Chthoniobacterales bacterium]
MKRNKLDDRSRVLVTGGAGFIGSALVYELNQIGIENIFIVDKLGSDEKWKNLVPLAFSDYLEADNFEEILADKPQKLGNFDFIFHLGACSSTTERNVSFLARNNFCFTRELCRFALSQGARFVYASSAATYGDGKLGMDDLDDTATALQKFRPLNAYGYSKQMFDLYAARAGYFDKIVGLKYFNVFGPNEYHKGDMRSLVCKAFNQILETGKIRLFKSYNSEYKDGEQMRDFLYVKDAVKMTLYLANSEETKGIYNLGAGIARTWLDLARSLFAAMERQVNIEFIEMPESIRDQYQYYTCANINKLRSSGYNSPITSLEDAVTDYVKNYLIPGRRLGEVG